MFLVYCGIGAAVRSPSILILTLPLAIVIRYGVVAREEAYLERRFGEILEAVPMSKILFGSDSWSIPEANWVAAKWGKRFMSRALAVHVKEGGLTRDEALEGARMMLYQNNRRVYNLPA